MKRKTVMDFFFSIDKKNNIKTFSVLQAHWLNLQLYSEF